jgi:crossover junction endodeoxyribonuclease RusA
MRVVAEVDRRGRQVTTIPLPWSKPPLTGNRTRGNPYARAKEVADAFAEALYAVGAADVPRMAGAEITLHFRPKDRRRRDADGMFPTLKVAQDAVVAAGILHEDSWVTIPSATCRIHPPNGQPAAMWLTLTDPDQETP